MSSFHGATRPGPGDFAEPGPARLRPVHLGAIAAAVLAGAAVWAVGLPATREFAGYPLSAYSLAAAIGVTLLGISLVGVWAAHTSWRAVEIVVGAVLGVACGIAFWILAQSWEAITAPLSFYPPAKAALTGVWVLPGVLGGLLLRRPGAALYVELVAAALEGLLPNGWGVGTLVYGLIQGLAAEMILAVLLYRSFGRVAALAAGALAGLGAGVLDLTLYYPDYASGDKVVYLALAAASGALIAGLGAVALARALGRSGALVALASGRDVPRV